MNIKHKQSKKTFYYAGYARKSKEEEDSRSILNQLAVLDAEMQTIIQQDNYNTYEKVDNFYDEDYTGTDSERPAFKRLLKLLGTGKINMLIITDLSRLSRNITESIQYVQSFFVALDIRFISIQLPTLDSFLQPEKVYSLEIPMQSMMNENHCAETSFKVRRTFDRLRADGKFIGAFAGYGWIKDPSDKHHLLLDEEAFHIMHLMKTWLIEGDNASNIAKKLNHRGIPNPSTYKRRQGLHYQNAIINPSSYWSSQSVRRLLSRPENIGDLIQGRFRVKSYKIHLTTKTPEEEWFICKGAIPSIFTTQEQAEINHCLSRNTRASSANKKGQLSLFSGFLICPDCGKSIVRKQCNHGNYVYYMCNTYKNYSKACTKHSIRHDRLEQAVLQSINEQIFRCIDMNSIMIQLHDVKNKQDNTSDLQKEIQKKVSELDKVKKYKQSLYERLYDEVITAQEYQSLKESFIEQEKEIEKTIIYLKEEILSYQKNCESEKASLANFYDNMCFSSLTREILNDFIDRIYVHEGNKITIQFKCSDPYKFTFGDNIFPI